MKLSSFKQDIDAAEDGKWVVVGDGFEIKIARSGNTKASNMLEKLLRPHRYALQNETISLDVLKDINNKVTAHTILMDWKGLEDDDGKLVPFSPQTAYDLLSNSQYRDLRDLITKLADTQELFRAEDIKELAKK